MGIDKCRLEFLLSLKVVMLKMLEFHKEELYATLSQCSISETQLSPAERVLTENSQAWIQAYVSSVSPVSGDTEEKVSCT